jgi:branched-chain amino acid transport system substrate-binding protein
MASHRYRAAVGFLALAVLGCQMHRRAADNRAIGVTTKEVIIGMTAANTGHAAFLGGQTYRGAQAWFSEVNQNGGVSGRQIKLVLRDDAYEPAKTAFNVQKLLAEDSAFALFGFVGTPTSVKALPLIERARVPAVGFFTGAESLRNPANPWVFHVRDSYYAEAEAAVAHFVDHLKLAKISVLYQEDAFGQAVLSGIQLALKRRNMAPVSTASLVRGSMVVEQPLEKLRASNPDAYLMVGTYSPLAKFVALASAENDRAWFHTVSFVGSEAYARELMTTQKVNPSVYERIIVTQVVPSPDGEEYPGVRQFRTLFTKYFPGESPNYVALEGFVDARVMSAALEKAGNHLDRDAFVRALEEMNNLDLGIGQHVGFGPSHHVGMSGVFLSRLGNDGKFRTFRP